MNRVWMIEVRQPNSKQWKPTHTSAPTREYARYLAKCWNVGQSPHLGKKYRVRPYYAPKRLTPKPAFSWDI